jgi:hypothetical protein
VWLLAAAATSLALAIAWRALRGARQRMHPATRARTALLAALAPSALPTLLVLLCLAPGIAGLGGWPGDHCTRHADHAHLCLAHPTAALTPLLAALLALAAALLLAPLGRAGAQLARTHRHLAALRLAARLPRAPGLSLVESQRPFSITTGIVRPRIWISTALTGSLSRDQLDVVAAHERAHARRRDPLRTLAAAALSCPLWPSVRREILAELALASEQACDEDAGRRVGDRLRVAETLLAVERLVRRGHAASATWLGFGGSSVPERVRSLLAERPSPPSPRLGWWAGALAGAAVFSVQALHHAVEHLLDALLRAL